MYFITTIEHLPQGDYMEMGDTRCIGYYNNFEKAEEAVINNYCDIWETCYNYCVIEKIPEGLYQYAVGSKYADNDRWFYKYNKETNQYNFIEEPIEFEHLCGLAIG
jgi:hypothetical protein